MIAGLRALAHDSAPALCASLERPARGVMLSAMLYAASSQLTPDEYLDLERVAETKSEYLDGQIYAMAGGTAPHAELAVNFAAEMRGRSKGGPYRIYSSDMRIAARSRNFVYPEVSRPWMRTLAGR